MQLKKTKSHRKSPRIQKIIKKKAKANKKRMKKLNKGKPRRMKKDPGIPNLYPFKKELLQKIIKNKTDFEIQKNITKQKNIQNDKEKLNNGSNEEKTQKLKLPPKNKIYNEMLHKVIDISDVILFVVDARDPNGCRDRKLEALIQSKESHIIGKNKKIVLILNKIDLVPSAVTCDWLNHLKRELPVLAFKASTQNQKRNLGVSKTNPKNITDEELSNTNLCVGAETLITLLKQYSHNAFGTKCPITVGVIGYPNVGKSSVINSLKRRKIVSTSPNPGHTKEIQPVVIDKKLKLLDSPGVILCPSTNYSTLVLKNSLRLESISQPEDFVQQILAKCPVENLCEVYQIAPYENLEEFLQLIGNRKGMIKKGGVVNTDLVAKSVIRDWNNGKISYYTEAPKTNAGEEINSIQAKNESFDFESFMRQNLNDVNVCEMKSHSAMDSETVFVPMGDDPK